jgi:hypothetical protein
MRFTLFKELRDNLPAFLFKKFRFKALFIRIKILLVYCHHNQF